MGASTAASVQPHTWLVLWLPQLRPDRLPTGHLCTGLADSVKGVDALEFRLHSLHQPQKGKGGSALHLVSGAGGHLIGRQAQDVLCQSQVYSKVLSAIFGLSCPCFRVLRLPQPSLSPLRTAPGTQTRWEPSLPGLSLLGSHHPGLL